MGDVFAVDFTCEKMTAAFVGDDGSPRETADFDLSDFLAGGSGAVDKLVGLLAAKARLGGNAVQAAMVTMPCDLDAKRERVVNFPRASWLNGQPLAAILREVMDCPVMMERRSVAMLSFDLAMLGLPTRCLAVGCYIDLQYDVAIWHNGIPVIGATGRAGNIMHLPVADRVDACFCGKAGCVGLYGTGLRARQIHSMIFPDTPMERLFTVHGDHPIIYDYIKMMAYPIAMAVNFADPDYLILGGDVLNMPDFPRKVLEEEIVQATYRPEDDGARFLASTVDGMVPGVVCGAQYARMKLAQDSGT